MKLMQRVLIILFFTCNVYAGTTEFYVIPVSGNNLNAGDNSTLLTDSSGQWSGVTASSYTASSGTPFASASVGQFASVYAVGASSTGYVSRITSVDNGGSGIHLSLVNFAGTAPSTGTASCNIGGAWKGPAGNQNFPFNIFAGTLVDVSSDTARLNLINTSSYTITTQINFPTNANPYPIIMQGYSSTPGDGGRTTIGANGAVITILNSNQSKGFTFADLILQDGGNGNFGGASGGNITFLRDTFKNFTAACVAYNNSGIYKFCEFTKCDTGNVSGNGAVSPGGNQVFDSCNIHDNPGSNVDGLRFLNVIVTLKNTIITKSGRNNIASLAASAGGTLSLLNCVIDQAGNDGLIMTNTSIVNVYSENTVYSQNGGYGIDNQSNSNNSIIVSNNDCFFQNTSGTVNGVNIFQTNNANLISTPYYNSSIEDFRPRANTVGLVVGTFMQTTSGLTTPISYPPVGALIPKPFPGGGSVISN